MKIKCFEVRTDPQFANQDQTQVNQFLEAVQAINITPQFIEKSNAWSILVTYTEQQATEKTTDPYGAKIFPYNGQNPLPRTIPPTPPKEKVKKQEKIAFDPETPLTAEEQHRFDNLRSWRYETAQALGIAAFMVASNAQLVAIAKTEIEQPEDLLRIKGFRDQKVETYGLEIVALLNSI